MGQVDDWRPIETAPKDGQLLRLWVVPEDDDACRIDAPTTGEQYRAAVFGRYPKEIIGWWCQARLDGYRALSPASPDYCGFDGFGPSKYRPTHWRPQAVAPGGPA